MCTSCKGFGDTACVYDKPASIAYVRHLEKKVKELSKSTARSGERSTLQEGAGQMNFGYSTQFDSEGIDSRASRFPETQVQSVEHEATLDKMMALATKQARTVSELERINILSQYSQLSRRYEYIALQTALQANFGYISFTTAKKCLDVYWSWFQSIHLSIYRPAFICDMAAHSPTNPFNQNCCYSPALLSIIFSDTITLIYGNCEIGKILTQHAHTLLMQDILFPATMATVIATLHRAVKSMQENNASNVWIFSGIANRLAEDLNLFCEPQSLDASMTVKDIEARTKLAWAVFYWDKVFSLYLGRLPSVVLEPFSFTGNLIDFSVDLEQWDPVLDIKGDRQESREINRILDTEAQHNLTHPMNYKPPSFLRTDEKPTASTSSQHFNTLTAASMQFKFSIIAVINAFIERFYGVKNTNLVSGTFSISNIGQIKNKPKEFFIGTKEYLRKLTNIWTSTSPDLKILDYTSKLSGSYANPTTVTNSLIYNSSRLILLISLLQVDDVIDEQEIDLGLAACKNTIQVNSLYISSFGKFNLNFWHEYSPYLASQFLLALLNQNHLPERREEGLAYLQALLKILRRPHFKLPDISLLLVKIEECLENEYPSQLPGGQENITPYKQPIPADPGLSFSIQKEYHPTAISTSQLTQHHEIPLRSAQSFPFQSQQEDNFVVQPPAPQLPVPNMAQENIIRAYNSNNPLTPDSRLHPYFISNIQDSQSQHYPQQIDMPQQMQQKIINPGTQYTFSRLADMPDISPAGIPGFINQFSPSAGSTTNSSTATASSTQDNPFHYQMIGSDEIHQGMTLENLETPKPIQHSASMTTMTTMTTMKTPPSSTMHPSPEPR